VKGLAAVVAVVAISLAACGDEDSGGGGGGGAPGTPEEAAAAYIEADRERDAERICELYSEAFREALAEDPDVEGDRSCEEVERSYPRDEAEEEHEVLDVEEIGGGKAIATVSCEDPTASDCSLPLVEEDGGWKVDSGLHPNDGEPVDFTTE
jgi:hypothetical protein